MVLMSKMINLWISFLMNHNYVIMMVDDMKYLTPIVEILDICPEGVLCGSNETIGEN